MSKVKYLTIIFFICNSCVAQRVRISDIQGVYVRKDSPNVYLSLEKNRFSFIDTSQNNPAQFKCCDTITHGDFEIDKKNGLLYLSSPARLNASYLNMDVNETMTASDSLTFKITNPIEKDHLKNRAKRRDIYYKIELDEYGMFLVKYYNKSYDTSIIKILKPDVPINKFSISIFPKDSYNGRNIGTKEINTAEYIKKNKNSNYFDINIPQLTYGYITYVRLNKDIVKIINRNTLEWDGKTYIKK